jgi:hypothetical protein
MISQKELVNELAKLRFPNDGFRLLQLAEELIKRLFWLRTEPHAFALGATVAALAVLRLSVPAASAEGYEQARTELMRALTSTENISCAPPDENGLHGMTRDSLLQDIEALKRTAVGRVLLLPQNNRQQADQDTD